jgi:hypothetical protein
MGFIGSILSTIFSPRIPQASVQQPTITGRELVASTQSKEPEAPQMGGLQNNRRRRGVESLLVPTEDIYKGGNN